MMPKKILGNSEKRTVTENRRNKIDTNTQILQSLKPFKSKKRKLFDNAKLELTPSQSAYNMCCKILDKVLTGQVDANELRDITVRELCSFFSVHYTNTFNKQCIDYNYFNAQKTFATLKDWLEYSSNIEVMIFICISFNNFEKARNILNLNDDYLTLATYKQGWIVDKLLHPENKAVQGMY